MTFPRSHALICSLVALAAGCQQSALDPDGESKGGSGPTAGAGALAGEPGAGSAGMGTSGSGTGMSGSAGMAPLGGMGGLAGTPAAGGAGSGSGGAPGGGMGGAAGLAGGVTTGGMSGDGAGGAPAAGTGGATTAGTGGSVGGAGTGGMSGAAGATSSNPCPDGCAELSVPFTAWNAGQYFEIYLSSATDLSAAVITVKARKIAGKAGGLLIVVKDGSAQNYAYAQGAWNAINDMTSEFKAFTLDVAAPSSTDENNTFTPTAVQIITVQIAAGGAWYTDEAETMEDKAALVNPTVVQIDEISIAGTGTLPGPWTFASAASDLKASITEDGVNASPPYAVTGSTVTWVGP